MDVRTHIKINTGLCGEIISMSKGKCCISLKTTSSMVADEYGLIHGGFIFGQADFAAMLAVNDPNVVLGSSEVRFLKPVKIGDIVLAEAMVTEAHGNKKIVEVIARINERVIFKGTFNCFVLDKHVLER